MTSSPSSAGRGSSSAARCGTRSRRVRLCNWSQIRAHRSVASSRLPGRPAASPNKPDARSMQSPPDATAHLPRLPHPVCPLHERTSRALPGHHSRAKRSTLPPARSSRIEFLVKDDRPACRDRRIVEFREEILMPGERSAQSKTGGTAATFCVTEPRPCDRWKHEYFCALENRLQLRGAELLYCFLIRDLRSERYENGGRRACPRTPQSRSKPCRRSP